MAKKVLILLALVSSVLMVGCGKAEEPAATTTAPTTAGDGGKGAQAPGTAATAPPGVQTGTP